MTEKTDKQLLWDWLKAEQQFPYREKVALNAYRRELKRQQKTDPDQPRPVPNRAARRAWKKAFRRSFR